MAAWAQREDESLPADGATGSTLGGGAMNAEAIAAKYHLPIQEVTRSIEVARRAKVPVPMTVRVLESGMARDVQVVREGVGPLSTEFGRFFEFSFRISDRWEKYSTIVLAPLDDSFRPCFVQDRPIRIRIDSGCETGQVFGDQTCECKDQLQLALAEISRCGQGLLVHIPRQDGRGMGLPFKLSTLLLQDALGIDTVESGSLLEPNKSRDIRTYGGVIGVLVHLGVPLDAQLELTSNNPDKLEIFTSNGYTGVSLVGCRIEPTPLTKHHLLAKQEHLGHLGLVGPEEGDGDGGDLNPPQPTGR